MPKNQDSLNIDLARQLKRYRPTMRDTTGKVVPVAEEAEVFQFHFTNDGEDYGTVTVSIDGLHKLVVYFGDSVSDSPKVSQNGDPTWEQLLVRLKNFAHKHQLSFELSDQDDLETDMAKREYTKKLDESYRAVGKKTSYNDSIPTVKVRIQHKREMQEGEQRFRQIDKIFIENADGERILAPTNKPGIAKIYGRVIAEGDKPYGERWNHVTSLVEEYTKMAGFVRATRGGQFNESAQQLVNEGLNHYQKLRETLHKLTGKKGYNTYFESWTPSLMEDEDQSDLSEMFMSSSLDPRIESVMPILSKLNKNISETVMSEVMTLESWADDIVDEALAPSTPAQLDDLTDILSKESLPYGADAINIINDLGDTLQDKDLEAELKRNASIDPDGDAKESILKWLETQTDPQYKKVLSKLKPAQSTSQTPPPPMEEATDPISIPEEDDDYVDPEEADYGDDYQAMVKRVAELEKQKAARKTSPAKTDESLDSDQKRAGQMGPTDKVSTGKILGNKLQSQKGLRGKLVAESVDPELARIRKLSGL